jgi:predicted ATPase with chaperone activity
VNNNPATNGRVEDYIPEPQSIEDTELSMSFLADLALKLIYYKSDMSSVEIAETLTLPFVGVMEHVLAFLKRENLIEIVGSKGFGETGYQWIITEKGGERAVQVLNRDRYIGPAPVPLERYNEMVLRQRWGNLRVGLQDVRQALSHLVLGSEVIDRIGPAVNSGRALFLYGPTGNGKTVIAEAIVRMLKGHVYIPHAIIVDGQMIRVFDEVNHKRVNDQPEKALSQRYNKDNEERVDRRWAKIQRPEIIVGGELVMQSLDLIYDPVSKTYEAPFQMKANTGLFVIDDFGRQAMRPQDLLNRWIVPLEQRVDFLTLLTGKKIEIPFTQLTVFATNLDPRDLVDDAFLRRIRHKLKIDFPDEHMYRQILERECAARNLDLSPEMFPYLMEQHYYSTNRRLRACHPRDILDQISDIASYRDTEPTISRELIDAACEGYFADI